MTPRPASRGRPDARARLRRRVGVAGYSAGWALLRAVPDRVARAGADVAADVARRRGGGARLRSNLARATGARGTGLDALEREALRSYARYWLEVFRLPVTPAGAVVRGATTTGTEHLDAALHRGRGVVLALPHSGNWDMAGAWLVATRTPFTTVAERLEPEALYRRFVRFREGLGMEVLPLSGGTAPLLGTLAERLRAGGVLCLLADRDLTDRGVDVTVLGGPGRAVAGPAVLALRAGAVLLPVTLAFDRAAPASRPGWRQTIHPPVAPSTPRRMTQDLADVFSAAVRDDPQDWHVLSRVWTDEPAGAAA